MTEIASCAPRHIRSGECSIALTRLRLLSASPRPTTYGWCSRGISRCDPARGRHADGAACVCGIRRRMDADAEGLRGTLIALGTLSSRSVWHTGRSEPSTRRMTSRVSDASVARGSVEANSVEPLSKNSGAIQDEQKWGTDKPYSAGRDDPVRAACEPAGAPCGCMVGTVGCGLPVLGAGRGK